MLSFVGVSLARDGSAAQMHGAQRIPRYMGVPRGMRGHDRLAICPLH